MNTQKQNVRPFGVNVHGKVVDRDGHAYVGNFGSLHHAKDVKPTCLIHIDPDGNANIAARKLDFPNGSYLAKLVHRYCTFGTGWFFLRFLLAAGWRRSDESTPIWATMSADGRLVFKRRH